MKFFTHDKKFYATLLHLMLAIVLQNIVTYSVNMADNLMLGSFSQNAMSGAATVNMIQFMFQVIVVSLGSTVVVVGSQYWGQKRAEPAQPESIPATNSMVNRPQNNFFILLTPVFMICYSFTAVLADFRAECHPR